MVSADQDDAYLANLAITFAQSLGFVADTDLLKQPLYSETPLANQSLILQSALGKSAILILRQQH